MAYVAVLDADVLHPYISVARVDHRLQAMRDNFPEAMTGQVGRYLAVIPEEVDEGDRHVAAAALAARADSIVTRNISDFAPEELFALGIEDVYPTAPIEMDSVIAAAKPAARRTVSEPPPAITPRMMPRMLTRPSWPPSMGLTEELAGDRGHLRRQVAV